MAHRPVVERVRVRSPNRAKPIRAPCIQDFNPCPGGAYPGTVRLRLHGLREGLDAAERELADKAIDQAIVSRDAEDWGMGRITHLEPGFERVVSHGTAVLSHFWESRTIGCIR